MGLAMRVVSVEELWLAMREAATMGDSMPEKLVRAKMVAFNIVFMSLRINSCAKINKSTMKYFATCNTFLLCSIIQAKMERRE